MALLFTSGQGDKVQMESPQLAEGLHTQTSCPAALELTLTYSLQGSPGVAEEKEREGKRQEQQRLS